MEEYLRELVEEILVEFPRRIQDEIFGETTKLIPETFPREI